jgi:hypothetical protein
MQKPTHDDPGERERRDRDHIAVADGAERLIAHHIACGIVPNLSAHIVLDRVAAGEQQHRAGQDHDAAEQRAPLAWIATSSERNAANGSARRQHAEQHQHPAFADQERDGRGQERQRSIRPSATAHIDPRRSASYRAGKPTTVPSKIFGANANRADLDHREQ